ncbi:putative DJ-1/PfpI family protein [Lyophyllum shimeji]|uniref:D-lactate dehydratase n=1 Tax=Lyophyllum shimeji TaxID=47721 RepID=A0A9P3PE18_LYOSH|nr:putative DJ-1/PfpI family protein [Lyophyllum shimeji]
MPSILFVYTSTNRTLSGNPTGWYLPEAAHPYWVLQPHFNIEFAAPDGPNPPVDTNSVKQFTEDVESVNFLKDGKVKEKFEKAKEIAKVNPADYDAIFYVGGHGPVLDLAFDKNNAALASQMYQAGKIISAVCHGPAALVGAADASGKSIFAGKRITGFSNAEEEAVGKVQEVPFLLETKIQELGGKFEKAPSRGSPMSWSMGNSSQARIRRRLAGLPRKFSKHCASERQRQSVRQGQKNSVVVLFQSGLCGA